MMLEMVADALSWSYIPFSTTPLSKSENTAVSKETGEGKDFIYNWRPFLDDRLLQQRRKRHEALREDKS